ncbi:hypothetical protein VTK73DRAFT_3639 [Phialemonium thermophilum]|uniref:Uncharacterized protein n=1 Tax=Phialemonium thermophilum TaxID=223376 RepID=A0ABR3VGB3_9PEZI
MDVVSPGQNAAAQPVDYQALKAWIAAMEAYEAANHKPAPLTPAQREAVSLLRLPAAPTVDVELDDTDWISKLYMFRDSNVRLHIEISLTEEGSPVWPGKWVAYCTYTDSVVGARLVFPGPVTGGLVDLGSGAVYGPDSPSNAGAAPPAFARKKDARRYAARCCVDWLVARGRVLSINKGVRAPALPLTATTPAPRSSSLPSPSPSPSPSSSSSSPPSPSLHRPAPTSTAVNPLLDNDKDVPSPRQRVQELCKRLGTPPPRIVVEEAADGGWNAWPLFELTDTFGHLVPDSVGRVEGASSKKDAKAVSAEGVLAWLLDVEMRRKMKLATLLVDEKADRP